MSLLKMLLVGKTRLCFVSALCLFSLSTVSTAEEPLTAYSYSSPQSSEPVRVLHYRLRHPLKPFSAGPSIELFSDQTMRVYRPTFWKNPGDYFAKLNDAEYATLIQLLAKPQLMAYEEQVAASRSSSGSELFEIHDADLVQIQIQLEQVEEVNGRQRSAGLVSSSLQERSPGLQARNPAAGSAVRQLAALDQQLRKLFNHPDLSPAAQQTTR